MPAAREAFSSETMDAKARDIPLDSVPPPPPSRRRTDGAESRVLRPRRAAPSDCVRPTRAEVNLAALRHNLRVLERHAGGAQVWPVLKADGYGHGAPAVARTLERAGAKGFCVALVEEAIELRDAGIRSPVMIMGGYYGDAHAEVIERDLIPVVYDPSHLEAFASAAEALERPVRVHVKIDTGMARLGVRHDALEPFVEALAARAAEIQVTGLMTHLACAEMGSDPGSSEVTAEQLARFEEATARLGRGLVGRVLRHAANSAAVLRGHGLFDVVRPGLAVFGVSPRLGGVGAPLSLDLRPVMRVRTEIVAVRSIEAGAPVGYGGTFRASRASRIATVPMGYADGMTRAASNRGSVLVRGKRAPIVGAVSMDMAMIDVTDIPDVSMGDEVVVLGAQSGPHGSDAITVDEIAEAVGTISWEVMTSISRRVPRFYREP